MTAMQDFTVNVGETDFTTVQPSLFFVTTHKYTNGNAQFFLAPRRSFLQLYNCKVVADGNVFVIVARGNLVHDMTALHHNNKEGVWLWDVVPVQGRPASAAGFRSAVHRRLRLDAGRLSKGKNESVAVGYSRKQTCQSNLTYSVAAIRWRRSSDKERSMPLEVQQPERERQHTAIHEAGHTITRIRFGLYIGKTTIEPNGYHCGVASGEESHGSQAAAEDEIMVSCAGYAALIAAGFDETTAACGCAQDFTEATELIEYWQLNPIFDWQQRTVELMRKPENIRAVDLLSNALIEYGTVGGEHAQVLLELADGEISEDDWLNFIERWPLPDGDPRYLPA